MGRDSKTARLMRDFWNEKARENATYYISSYRDYDDQDPEEFWRWGATLADKHLKESQIPLSGDETILEIGCGIGRMTRAFAQRFQRVYGLDISAEMVGRAKENLKGHPNVEIMIGNGVDLGGYEDETMDLVYSYITLQHIPDKQIALDYIREFGRVLRKGGHAYFQVNNLPNGLRGRLRLRSRLRNLLAKSKVSDRAADAGGQSAGAKDLDHPAWIGSRISLQELRAASADAGLRIMDLNGEGTQYLWVKAQKVGDSAG
jgi:ubiquinone/menaquinone biosynthesis C-methylase UbiE